MPRRPDPGRILALADEAAGEVVGFTARLIRVRSVNPPASHTGGLRALHRPSADDRITTAEDG